MVENKSKPYASKKRGKHFQTVSKPIKIDSRNRIVWNNDRSILPYIRVGFEVSWLLVSDFFLVFFISASLEISLSLSFSLSFLPLHHRNETGNIFLLAPLNKTQIFILICCLEMFQKDFSQNTHFEKYVTLLLYFQTLNGG